MKLYKAETGQQIPWLTSASSIQSLEEFKQQLEICTGVPIENQILMTSFGTQVKQEYVKDVLESVGQDEYIIFCYDRHYLGASPEETNTLLKKETPKLEPTVPMLDVATSLQTLIKPKPIQKPSLSQTCESYLTLFAQFDTYSQTILSTTAKHTQMARTIVEEQKAQRMALNVAIANLESHNHVVFQGTQAFCTHAEKELRRQTNLIETTDIDLALLRSIHIHPSLLEDIHPKYANDRLIDFVQEKRIVEARTHTHTACQHLAQEICELRALADDLLHYETDLQQHIGKGIDLQTLDTTLDDTQVLHTKAQFIRDKIKRDMSRIHSRMADVLSIPLDTLSHQPFQLPESLTKVISPHAKKTFEAFQHLAEIHVKEYLLKLAEYEATIRKRVDDLVTTKQQAMRAFLENMNVVSQLQSEIAAVAPRLQIAERELADFKQNPGLSAMETARDVLFAYGALMIEFVRRKEYLMILSEHTHSMAGVLVKYRDQEEERRELFRQDISESLPFKVKSLLDKAFCYEIPVVPIPSTTFTMSQKDIIDFITQLGRGYAGSNKERRQNNYRVDLLRRISESVLSESLADSSTRISRRAISRDTQGERVIRLLNTMNKQLDGLKTELLKSMESTFFADDISHPLPSLLGMEAGQIPHKVESILQQKTKALSTAQGQIKIYESRINSLEKTLQHSFRSNPISPTTTTTNELESDGIESSTFSVIEEKETKAKDMAEDQFKEQLADYERTIESLKHQNEDLHKTVQQLEVQVKTSESERTSLQEHIEHEQEKWEEEREHDAHDREDMRLQIQELEQLLEDERQMYEHNRKSLLNEAKIKDNLADIRVADIEEDWHTKMRELDASLEEQKQECHVLREENKELLSQGQKQQAQITLLHTTLEEELSAKQTLLDQHSHAMKSLHSEKNALVAEHQHYTSVYDHYKTDYEQYKSDHEHLQHLYTCLEQQLANERQEAQQRLDQLLLEMDTSEKAKNEIKQRLAQAREMVARAESDWMEKNQALARMVAQQTVIKTSVTELLIRYAGVNGTTMESSDTIVLLDLFKQYLEAYTTRSNTVQEDLTILQQEHLATAHRLERLHEEHTEWQGLLNLMADKLEEFRKEVIYEITHQLHLPVEEDEVGLMTRRLQTTQDNGASRWNEVLQATHGINTQNFVNRIRRKVKDAHDLTRRWQKEYKQLKEKYTQVASSAHEKIAFRNFKVGDVALFLPTRNSTGNPWAAFNVNAPHYFLKPSDSVLQYMATREWIVARIICINEHCVDKNDATTNPFGLANGLKFYQLEVEHWRGHHSKLTKTIHKTRHSDKQTKELHSLCDGFPRRYSLSPTTASHDIGLASLSLDKAQAASSGSSVSTINTATTGSSLPKATTATTTTTTQVTTVAGASAISTSTSANNTGYITHHTHRSHLSMSRSSNNIVHSYAPSTSPPSHERRSSTGHLLSSVANTH